MMTNWMDKNSVDAAIERGDWRTEKIAAQREWVEMHKSECACGADFGNALANVRSELARSCAKCGAKRADNALVPVDGQRICRNRWSCARRRREMSAK